LSALYAAFFLAKRRLCRRLGVGDCTGGEAREQRERQANDALRAALRTSARVVHGDMARWLEFDDRSVDGVACEFHKQVSRLVHMASDAHERLTTFEMNEMDPLEKTFIDGVVDLPSQTFEVMLGMLALTEDDEASHKDHSTFEAALAGGTLANLDSDYTNDDMERRDKLAVAFFDTIVHRTESGARMVELGDASAPAGTVAPVSAHLPSFAQRFEENHPTTWRRLPADCRTEVVARLLHAVREGRELELRRHPTGHSDDVLAHDRMHRTVSGRRAAEAGFTLWHRAAALRITEGLLAYDHAHSVAAECYGDVLSREVLIESILAVEIPRPGPPARPYHASLPRSDLARPEYWRTEAAAEPEVGPQPEPEEGAAAARRAALVASSASHASMFMPAAPTSPAQVVEGEALLEGEGEERKRATRRSEFANSSASHHSMFIAPEEALEPGLEAERRP
jgi:hypothetical protein